jgi:aldehyde:ferredoxin oxidoreductase
MSQGGYHRRYLVVNLNDKSWKAENLPEEITSSYLGGRGIATKLLYDLQAGHVDPLSPQNNLIVFTGPLAGTNTPGSSRIMFTTKSPLSNAVNATSMGGTFPNAFKGTGFDGLVITGKSENKVWLHITPEGVAINPAEDLWGLKTSETETAIKERAADKCRVACIGPAGENQVLYAAIVSETRTASRGGAGAVMGSKNLKAIAVSGAIKPPIADKEAFDEAIKKIRDDQKENPGVVSMQMNGTAGLISVVNAMGGLPTRNFQTGTFEGAEEIAGSAITEKNRVKGFACASCPVGCSLIAEIKSGTYKGTQSEGPEYESTVMLGSNLGISDLDTIIAANYLCDEYGLDTISAGNVIGFAMECYEKGLLTDTDTGGRAFTWGNSEVVLSLFELIAQKEGIGERLAQGVARLSKEIPGSESFAMHVKGLELAAYDPRAVFGQGLSYAIAPRGGEHGRGGYMIVEFFMPDVDLYTHEGKAAKAIQMAEDAALYDLSCLCSFNFVPIPLIPQLITAVVGKKYTEDDLRKITRRVITLERKFNIREGFTRKDDTLPPRLLNEPLPEGMAEGKKVEGLDIMLDDYYALRGWDSNGIPLNGQ